MDADTRNKAIREPQPQPQPQPRPKDGSRGEPDPDEDGRPVRHKALDIPKDQPKREKPVRMAGRNGPGLGLGSGQRRA